MSAILRPDPMVTWARLHVHERDGRFYRVIFSMVFVRMLIRFRMLTAPVSIGIIKPGFCRAAFTEFKFVNHDHTSMKISSVAWPGFNTPLLLASSFADINSAFFLSAILFLIAAAMVGFHVPDAGIVRVIIK